MLFPDVGVAVAVFGGCCCCCCLWVGGGLWGGGGGGGGGRGRLEGGFAEEEVADFGVEAVEGVGGRFGFGGGVVPEPAHGLWWGWIGVGWLTSWVGLMLCEP